MPRFVIQSAFTGMFLTPSHEDGQPEWVMPLSDAVAVEDIETCVQLIEDHVDHFHRAVIVDLSSLRTVMHG